ncbi:hypothetical protein C5613_37260 [Rhodococcus opacus]|uniref:Uncharacterized protein n=2 Tax=Rhodococcus opacus TaxID=37919 RepID=A0A2S8IMY4_RHOOP|nr:hypothetical protein C5613_37260 [Rhodococcus opacus]
MGALLFSVTARDANRVPSDMMTSGTDLTVRRAATYTVAVMGGAVVVALLSVAWMSIGSGDCAESMMECAGGEKYVLVFGPPALLLLGGVGAFVQTYRVWRAGGRWPIWQGAGWMLFVFMLIYASLSAGALTEV